MRCVRGVGSSISGNFTKANGVVSDSNSGLQWKNDVSPSYKKWMEAINHCEGLSFNGHNDWRVPNINELTSILDYSHSFTAINSAFQISPTLGRVWSSSHIRTNKGDAKVIQAGSGETNVYRKDLKANVMCVRSDY